VNHTSTQDSPLALWDTGTIAVGDTKGFQLRFAGRFPCHCTFHASGGMVGKVRVPLKLSATSVPPGTMVTVTVATVHAPQNFVYDVQQRLGTAAWTKFRRGLKTKSIDFPTDTPGTYAFRSRLRHRGGGRQSNYSPFRSVTVLPPA
jgi:hypothetical protein